jgi:oxygen-dependent protoporphyrinogen oxidase
VARVLIIGGGLAGLTAAFRLRDCCEVVLLEASARLGGQVSTELSAGFVIEHGAEGFVARSEAVPALVRDLGMPEGELVGQALLRSYGFDGQRLLELEAGEAASWLGFQVPVADLGQGIRSLRRGMGSLVSALEGNLRGAVELRLGASATRVEMHERGVGVQLERGPAVEADALIVATSAASASALLTPSAGEPARALREAPTLSSVTVELAYERAAIEHPLDGTGFVVADGQQRDGLRACTWTTSKFADRSPPDKVSLRLFFRPSSEQLARLDDAAWTELAVCSVGRVLVLRGDPLRSWVSRWPNALPVWNDAYRTQVAALEQALRPYPIVLAGSAFHGSGIDAAVRSGGLAPANLLRCAAGIRL